MSDYFPQIATLKKSQFGFLLSIFEHLLIHQYNICDSLILCKTYACSGLQRKT